MERERRVAIARALLERIDAKTTERADRPVELDCARYVRPSIDAALDA